MDAYRSWTNSYNQQQMSFWQHLKPSSSKNSSRHSVYGHPLPQNIYHRNAVTTPIGVQVSKGDFQAQQETDDMNEVLRRLFYSKNIDIGNSKKLGAGRYSKVITAHQFRTNNPREYKIIAIKMINTKKVTQEFKEKFLPREIDCWRQLNHPNLVRILGHYEALDYVFLSMEYGEKGNLLSYVQRYSALHEPLARVWLKQIIKGVSHMHSLGISHRDLKLENIIIFGDGSVKVTDFGFSRRVYGYSETYCGSKSYSAPEILMGKSYTPFKADVWSIGVIGFILVTDTMPFRENVPNKEIVKAQKNRDYRYPKKIALSQDCMSTMDQMMTFEPSYRPAIWQCLSLPFFSADRKRIA